MYHDNDMTISECEESTEYQQNTIVPNICVTPTRLGMAIPATSNRTKRTRLTCSNSACREVDKFKKICEEKRNQCIESIFERQQLIYNYIENGHVPATDDSDYLQSSASSHHLEHIRQNIDDFYYDSRGLYVTIPGTCRVASTTDTINDSDSNVRLQIKRTSDYTEISRTGLYNINALYRHHDGKVYHIDICMFANDQANSSHYVRSAFVVTALWLRNTHYCDYYNCTDEYRYIDGPWQFIDDHSI